MDVMSLLIQVVSGAIGGNAAGAAMKNYTMGTLGNTIAGAIGGGVVGQLVGSAVGTAAEGYLADIGGGAIGGIILTILAGMVGKMMAK
jgi:uncharacterized membrane protein YeaQ/YmgE (transglycosylase-associated protein family)